MSITVYTSSTCPWCVKTEEFLKSLNVDFEIKNITGDKETAMYIVKKTHQMGVPVTQIGDKFIIGYKPEEIEAELKAAGIL